MTEEGLTWSIQNIATKEHYLQTDPCKTYYRIWGTGPIKAIFLHGGPGNCVADYSDVNFKILDPAKYTVVEIDQFGTGNTLPSVREGMHHAKVYRNLKAQDIVNTLIRVLDEIKWDKVFLHGGSWGSGLALLFAIMYPERVSGMVIRGIFTGTQKEMDVIYTKKGAGSNPDMNEAFDKIYAFAKERGYKGGDDNAKEFVKFFRDSMLDGNPDEADMFAWNWYVQECIAMGEKEYEMNKIVEAQLGEARSVAFWESHVFYEMLWGEDPVDILRDLVKIPRVPIYIVQGRGDEVCPPEFALNLEKLFRAHDYDVTAYYVDDGHKVTGSGIRDHVRLSAIQFSPSK